MTVAKCKPQDMKITQHARHEEHRLWIFSSCNSQSVIDYWEDRLQIYWTSVEQGFHLQQLNYTGLRNGLEEWRGGSDIKECLPR